MAHLRLHPFPLYLLNDFCRRNEMSLAWLLDCMDPAGKEAIPQGTAAEIEIMSKGEVPLTSWPRLKRIILGSADEVQLREGRPTNNPQHPVHAYLKDMDKTLTWLGEQVEPKIGHQRITHYIVGRRTISRELADELQKISKGQIPWTCWALLKDQKTRVYYHFGKALKGREHAALSKELKKSRS